MTTRHLVLIRHAKAASHGGADSQRPLAERGVKEAPAVGRWLSAHGVQPDRVVVSPARRARQTWELSVTGVRSAPQPVLDERLYRNTVEDMLEVIRETPVDVRTLILVGHNPSVQELAIALDDGSGDAAGRKELAQKYPTSGVAVFDVDTDWAQVDRGAVRLASFTVPRG